MSPELFEVISLAARYLFSLLGVLIVLRAFHWLISDSHSTRRLRKGLFLSGMIGELVVIVPGSDELREGQALSVPWEGLLGSVRSCDIYVPDSGIRRNHLSFCYENGRGLLIRLRSGCEAWINSVPVDCRTKPDDLFLRHGDYFQAGKTLLRLRLFSSFDLPSASSENRSNGNDASFPPVETGGRAEPDPSYSDIRFPSDPARVDPMMPADAAFPEGSRPLNPNPAFPSSGLTGMEHGHEGSDPFPDSTEFRSVSERSLQTGSRKESDTRRGSGWEADWSE